MDTTTVTGVDVEVSGISLILHHVIYYFTDGVGSGTYKLGV